MANELQERHGARIRAISQYIRTHIHEPLDRQSLAEMAGLSIPHFHRIFTQWAGQSPSAYVRQERLLRAGRKLRMGAVDIGTVALAAGYDSHTSFSKAFKRHFGMSPSEFRELDCWTATKLLRKG